MKNRLVGISLFFILLSSCEDDFDLRKKVYPNGVLAEGKNISYTAQKAFFESTLLLFPESGNPPPSSIEITDLQLPSFSWDNYQADYSIDSIEILPSEKTSAENIVLIDQSSLAQPWGYDDMITCNFRIRGLIGYCEKTNSSKLLTKFYAHASNNPYLSSDLMYVGNNESAEKVRDSLLALSLKFGGTLNLAESINAIVSQDSFFSQSPNVQKYITCIVTSYSDINRLALKQAAVNAIAKGIVINIVFCQYSKEDDPDFFTYAEVAYMTRGWFDNGLWTSASHYINLCHNLADVLMRDCLQVKIYYSVHLNQNFWNSYTGIYNTMDVKFNEENFSVDLYSIRPF